MIGGVAFLFICFGVLGLLVSVAWIAYARGRDVERDRLNEDALKRIRHK